MKTLSSDTPRARIKPRHRNDLIFIGALLAAVGVAVLALWLFSPMGETVIVTVDGQQFGEYPLDVDRRVEISNGDGYNVLIIEDGLARMEKASCPDGICTSHRPIKRAGESIICLPNKVVVEIHSKEFDTSYPDIIN